MNVDDLIRSLSLSACVVENDKEPEMRYIVRVTTSAWRDKGGFHYKKSVRRMERLSTGFDFLGEDCSCAGHIEGLELINNLTIVDDGLYELIMVGGRDYEGNYELDYYKLIPYERKDKKC